MAPPTTSAMYRQALASTLAVLTAASAPVWFLMRSEAPLPPDSSAAASPEDRTTTEPIRPVEPHTALDAAKVELGRLLFHDPRLSRDGTVSCATCHDLRRGGVDRLPRARGVGGAVGAFNTPTVYNAWLNPVQFWDGRADSLEAQMEGPLTSPEEMGSSWAAAVRSLQADTNYVRRFAASYPDGVTPSAVADAVAEFERSLTTVGSRFDRFLRGDTTALTDDEAEGYRAFKSYGCASCHQGANVGGNLFQTLGVFGDYFADRGEPRPADLGRYNVTGRDEDRHRFRVPSLRLAAVTPPYFHDGSASTLEEAVRIMARYQLGREIDPNDERRIVLFLNTLPGDEARP
jgi:cytochrome c peroxidase